MPSLSSHEKELRFALLSMFPSAGLKEVSEAARSGHFDVAVEILRAAERAEPVDHPPVSVSAEPVEPASAEPVEPVTQKSQDAPEEGPIRKFDPARVGTGNLGLESDVGISPEVLTEALAAAASEEAEGSQKQSQQSKHPGARGGYNTQDGWEIRCHVDYSRTCQSLRTLRSPQSKIEEAAKIILQHVGTDNTAAFAAACFERMVQREQEMDDDFCVFYHHYNGAALLYEVQAEIARYAFDLPDTFAPLPRVLLGHFTNATLEKLKLSYAAIKGQDHDPWFRSLAISASPTLFAFGSEAPPLRCFRQGYGCGVSFRELITNLLKDVCWIQGAKAQDVVHELSMIGAQFGLQVGGYSHKACPALKSLGGHMLQIFISKKVVKNYVYHSRPFGIPIETELDLWLANPEAVGQKLDGQVRILFDPELFLSGNGHLFHYCGDWQFLGGNEEMKDSRAACVAKIRRVLEPILRTVPVQEIQRRLRNPGQAKSKK